MLSVSALVFPLLVWAGLSYYGWVKPIFLPTPSAVFQAGILMATEESLWADVVASFLRVLWGFLAAAVVGIPVGLLMGTFSSMDSIFGPIVGIVRYMPLVAFTPLIILWVGLGEESKILIIFLGIVFYNALMIADSVKFIPNEMLNAAYTLGATRVDLVFRVILPAALPSILDALRVNVAGAWNFLVISELLAAENGLGFKIVYSQRFLQTDKVLFNIVLIGLIGLLLDFAFKRMARVALPWAEHN